MDFCRKQVKLDCEELLSRFQRTESVRFEIFSRLWREMNFAHIFYGTVGHEKRAFSQLILDTACSFFLPPFSFQIRVGGLYLLYSLFHSQTAEPREQIRLALKDWEEVKKFEKNAVDAQHHDTVYILQQLMLLKAFYFTAMPSQLAFKKKKKVEKSVLCEDFIERASRPQELITIELLEELSNINDLYEKLKTSVASSEAAVSSINLVRTDLVPQLRSTVVDFYKWQQNKEETDGEEVEDSGEGTSSQQECSERADRLAAIKSRAYGQATEATKSRRHRQVELDFTSHVAGPSHLSGHNRLYKPSLKARTLENVHISGDKWKEVTSDSFLNRLTTLDFIPEEKPRTSKKFKW